MSWLSENTYYKCRTLRKMGARLQRLKVDIRDFEPGGLPSLAAGQQPWVAMGKHLCGAATDFTLRCVVRSASAALTGCLSHSTTAQRVIATGNGASGECVTATDADAYWGRTAECAGEGASGKAAAAQMAPEEAPSGSATGVHSCF